MTVSFRLIKHEKPSKKRKRFLSAAPNSQSGKENVQELKAGDGVTNLSDATSDSPSKKQHVEVKVIANPEGVQAETDVKPLLEEHVREKHQKNDPRFVPGTSADDSSHIPYSFSLNLYPDGFVLSKPSSGTPPLADLPRESPTHPYDRSSRPLLQALDAGLIPADLLGRLPCAA
eukprot:CAMPEP_0118947616 /NCGR_PEP_ID=MMETSP1169-20130426/46363_1 /TAXON_ID=36882 /ORGANISM="Pyramimonas obovata, Strain CCMP722" /LENGTH=173 /DNA_ID=CAMNT_0006893867 /DNA_START=257 /DNA_END=774 /DNA_ORIENTATION=+